MPTNVMIMVISIVLITTFGRIYMAKHGLTRSSRRASGDVVTAQADPDADRMREEIRTLKDRIAVLERIATDTNSSASLDREIEKLR
jgi:hypothetical protein